MTAIDPNLRFDPAAFRWAGVEQETYKDSPGHGHGMGWKGVTRHTLASPGTIPAGFEMRYFELEPGGYSSLEKHEHVHFVVALRGAGRALIGERVHELAPYDALYVPPLMAHRWLNAGPEPFGFLCTVDGKRDRPRPVDDDEWERLGTDPNTAPYVF
ncbi:MAG TPA: cupin domain-containing protein [Solirubrobacteraceae bacterium]|jgi:quercetin dioxygenase-like cupin family protein|nr:cupin domain-containing protein [Solirubrobacteraceae bacterium]